MKTFRAVVVCALAGLALPCLADVWDTQSDSDNNTGTDNELVHGSLQVHDLAALSPTTPDEDWYLLGQKPRSSYEIVVDETSGDIGDKGVAVHRMASDGSTELQTSASISVGLDFSRSLRWENTSANVVNDQFIRIRSTNCTTDCNADDVYRIRAYETTYSIPRFNNAGGQISVLIIQNPADYVVTGNAYFYNTTGVVLFVQPFTINGRNVFQLISTSIPALVGQGGSVTVSHNARYGDLAGKMVSLEPATGFSFDTPLVWRPR